jgi:GDPmannose 4,6-dehydratase
VREFLSIAFSTVGIEDWSNLVIVDQKFYRPAEVDYLRGDCSKAKEKLKWQPKHSFEDLVRLMVMSDLS